MKDYLLQQMRESSTWRGMIDIVVGVFIEYGLAHVTFLSSELTMMMHAVAAGFIMRGGIAVGAKDTTTAGQAVKTAQAMDKLELDPPKLPTGTTNPTGAP